MIEENKQVTKERLNIMLQVIRDDAENDANSLENKPFNGETVGAMFGNILAAISALARAIQDINNTADGAG